MLDRSIPPASSMLEAIHEIQEAASFTLDNGIPVHLLLSGSQPLLKVEIIFEAGTWFEAKEASSYFTSKLLSAGTPVLTAWEIENSIAYYGAFIDLESGPDRGTVTLYCLSKYLRILLPLVYDIINHSQFPPEEILNLKNITRQNLKINEAKTSYLASVAFKRALFGNNHPYGRTLGEDSIHELTREDILEFYRKYFNHRNCHIIISGNGQEDFLKLFNEQFGQGSWGSEDTISVKTHTTATETGAFSIPKEDSIQSSIRLGRRLFPISHPDYLSTFILMEILGGYFGSRLMKNIREDKGYTYGIHANFVVHKHDGYMVIGTDVNGENTQNTLTEIRNEMQLLKTNPVGSEELHIVKNYLLGSFLNSLNTPFSLADKFKTIYFNGLDYSFYSKYIQTIREIQPEQLLLIANKYFSENEFVEIVAGGENKN
jgi:zinc protease